MHPLRFLGTADQSDKSDLSAKSAQSSLIVLLSDCFV
jgi:hypothetical protein